MIKKLVNYGSLESTHKNSVWPHKKVYQAHKNFSAQIFENGLFLGVLTHTKGAEHTIKNGFVFPKYLEKYIGIILK